MAETFSTDLIAEDATVWCFPLVGLGLAETSELVGPVDFVVGILSILGN